VGRGDALPTSRARVSAVTRVPLGIVSAGALPSWVERREVSPGAAYPSGAGSWTMITEHRAPFRRPGGGDARRRRARSG